MNFEEIHSSSEDLCSTPLLKDIVIRKECKYKSPINHNADTYAKTKLTIATVLCSLFFLAEIIGGILANSLAILSDSAHLFSDLSSFLISLAAIFLSARPPSRSMTYGCHRAEILGALFSVLLIWLVTGVLVYAAILRIINTNYIIDANIMLIMAGAGVIINVILAFVLHPHSHSHSKSNGHLQEHGHSHGSIKSDHSNSSDSHVLAMNSDIQLPKSKIFKQIENINLRAAFIHVIGDIIQSFGVLAAAFVIYFKPEWKIADPICTFLFSFLVILTTVLIFRDVINVLLERKPRHINYNNVENQISSIPGVIQIHNLRLWSITMTRTALSCHVLVDSSVDSQLVLDEIHCLCTDEFKFSDITIQLESKGIKTSISYDQSLVIHN